ncbi:MAG: prohibitin family protein [Saprospiraceae bacterium]|nr:prohibitin family protein [Saprospiraceae bacterium]
MKNRLFLLIFLLPLFGLLSCTVVREGQAGVKRRFGTYNDKPYTSGLKFFNPFTSSIVKVSTQTENLEVQVDIPSKEGLTIRSDVSILYHLKLKETPNVLRNIGVDYESTVILPVFRSAMADVSSRYYAKDMHSGQSRADIENAIRDLMTERMGDKGIVIENVLLKSIQLPRSLAAAIEQKLEAEQLALRMEFVLQQEKQEAQRKRLQAEGVRDANAIINEGLSPAILQYKSIEAWMQLSQSPNTKILVGGSGGQIPMVITPADMKPD